MVLSASWWRNAQRRMDAYVDKYFSVAVELHPWMEPGRYSGAGDGPDPSRPVFETRAIVAMPGAAITGEGGTQGAGLDARIVTNNLWLSITEDNLGSSDDWHVGDRVLVKWPEDKNKTRDEWYELSYITPSVTDRPNVNLIRIQTSDVSA